MPIKTRLPAGMLALLAAFLLACFYNIPLWQFVVAEKGLPFALQCLAIVTFFYGFVLALLALPRVQKPVIGLLLLLGAGASYFIHKYGILIDSGMIRNAAQTDPAEAGDLMGPSFALWMFCLFLLPAGLLWRLQVVYAPRGLRQLGRYLALPAICAALMLATAWGSMQQLAPFYRNHREVRHMIVPYNVVAATIKYTRTDLLPKPGKTTHVATPSQLAARPAGAPRRVVVFVVGETARAANFSLGGYGRPTNPALGKRDDIVYFSNFTSCGTYTAFSLPCIFSSLGRKEFKLDKFDENDNLMQQVANAGVNALWVDNNAGCKGVCTGVEIIRETDLAKKYPQHCQAGECHDEALVDALETALSRKGDLFIVLHQEGSHGPLYYKRVPNDFAKFQPACRKADFGKCTPEEIVNAYDNTILYTDHVLDSLIEVLAPEQDAALFYVSDHGKSLGENGMYLHGTPYMLAPDEQTHIPAVLWLSRGMQSATGLSLDCLKRDADKPRSHDDIFATLLHLNGVATAAAGKADLYAGCGNVQTLAQDGDGKSPAIRN